MRYSLEIRASGHHRMNLAKAWLLCWAVGASAQAPEIARGGVVSAASNTPIALAGSAIPRGALLTIRGTRFKPFSESQSDLSVKLVGPAGEKALAITAADSSSVTARVPADAPLGPASLTVVVERERSAPYSVKVVRAQFGIYAVNGKGWGPGRIQNLSGAERRPNGVTNAANFSQTLALSGTGLGDTKTNDAKTPAVFIGGRPAKVVAVRASPDGDEILFKIPANAPEGCFVPVQVRNAGLLPSNTVTVAIHNGGGSCREPEYFPFAGWPDSSFGFVAITRTEQREYGIEAVSDEVAGWFGRLPILEKLNPYFLLPPPGTCTSEVEPWRGGFVSATLISLLASHTGAQALRAGGEITINDGKTLRRVPAFRGGQGVFDRELSDSRGRADRLLHFVSPTVVHVAGKGGSDVGRFSFALGGPEPFEMPAGAGPVRRGQPLRLEWTDMGAGRIAIVFANFVDEATGSRGMCYCVGTPGATGLTIPASTLAYFPPASSNVRISLTVAAWPLRPVIFQATGLEHALAISAFMQHFSVGPNPSSFRERN
jgi:uncharacterized protein (TIGR03437 family)